MKKDIYSGKNKMSVTAKTVKGFSKKGKLSDLRLVENYGKKNEIVHTIIKVPEEIEIATKHNPNCTWVFRGGQWWYVCG